jgi:hypothetical protein
MGQRPGRAPDGPRGARGASELSLAQKLKAFEPDRHGGEAMASGRLGAETF